MSIKVGQEPPFDLTKLLQNTMNSSGLSMGDVTISQLQAAIAAGLAGTPLSGSLDQGSLLQLSNQLAISTMNNLVTQQNAAQNTTNILANAAKMMLGINHLQQTPPQPSDLLSIIMNANMAQANAVSSAQESFMNPLIQQYAALARAQSGLSGLSSQLGASQLAQSMHMSLKKTVDNTPQIDRKRSLPTPITDEIAKKKNGFVRTIQQHQETTHACVPLTKADIHAAIDKILNEELFDDEDSDKEDVKIESADLSPATGTDGEESKDSINSDSPLDIKDLTLMETLDFISTDPNEAMLSPGSAFRKVSCRGDPSALLGPTTDLLVPWGVSVSPPDSSPSSSEPDMPPASPGVLTFIQAIALTQKPQEDSLPLRRSDQLQKNPVVWRGMLQVKHSTVNVQLFKIFGSNEFTELCLNPAVAPTTPQDQLPNLKINQRMRIEGNRLRDVFSKLPNGSACICLASGTSKEETSRNNISLNQEFVEYLNQKCSAGISVFPENRLSYILPPNEYTDRFLSSYSPVLYQKLKSNPSLAYLFVALIPSDVVAAPGAENGAPVSAQ